MFRNVHPRICGKRGNERYNVRRPPWFAWLALARGAIVYELGYWLQIAPVISAMRGTN